MFKFVTMRGHVIHEYLRCNIPPFKKLLTSLESPIKEMSGENTCVTESTHCINKATPRVGSRSQRPRGLRHEPSSSARTLGSWVQIPLKAWMSACIYSVFVLSCVGSGLATGWSPVQRVLPTVQELRNWSEIKRFTVALCSKVGPTGNSEKCVGK
jgi:hypothetical protein